MDDSQPRQQQNRSRGRLVADGQTSRRPRAVAGQRAAAKRATQPVQRSRAGQLADPVRDDEIDTRSDELAASAENAQSEEREQRAESSAAAAAAGAGAAAAGGADAGAEHVTPKVRATRTARPARPVRRALVTAVLAIALIAAIAVGAVFAVQYRDAIRTDHARTAAIAAAERAAPVIFSYDYRHLDQDFSKAEAYLTGAFRSQYAKTTQTVVKPTAAQYHGVVQATVAKPGDGSAAAVSVVSATPDQVVVLAFIDQSTTSTRVTGTQVDQNRVLLTLTHTAQGWLVSAVDAL